MADAEIRPLRNDALTEDIIGGINTALGILRGNVPGHFKLFGSDGVQRAIRGGATLATGKYALEIQSAIGLHLNILDSSGSPGIFQVEDDIIKVRPTTFEFLLSGTKILGDMATVPRSNRISFQSNTGAESILGILPPTGNTTAGLSAFNNPAPDSASIGAVMLATATAMEFRAESPSGVYAPIDWYTNATHQWRLDTAGALIAQGTGKRIMGDFSNATVASRLLFQNSVVNGASSVSAIPNGTAVISDFSVYNASNPAAASFGLFRMTSTDLRIVSSHAGASYLPIVFHTNGAEQARVSEAGGFRVTAMDPPLHDTQVTPGSQCKAFAYVTGGGGATLGQNYNIASVTRNGAGDFTVAWDRDFSAATYALTVTVHGTYLDTAVNSQTSSSADIHFRNAGVLTDPDAFALIAQGTLS